jgi:hypothetical protein
MLKAILNKHHIFNKTYLSFLETETLEIKNIIFKKSRAPEWVG